MPTLLAIAMLLLVAAITPGPNNLVMMHTAAHGGVRGALPAMLGIVLGGTVMLAVIATGLGAVFSRWPALKLLIAVCGGMYLVWLGWRLMSTAGGEDSAKLPAGIAGLFVFQFLNPKGWVMLLAVVSALPSPGALQSLVLLAPLFVGISAGCLLLWATAGRVLALAMNKPSTRIWIDRVLGASLIAGTLALFH